MAGKKVKTRPCAVPLLAFAPNAKSNCGNYTRYSSKKVERMYLWKNKKEKLSLRRKTILRHWKERLIQAAEGVVVELHLAASWRGCSSSERRGPWVVTAVEGELEQPGP